MKRIEQSSTLARVILPKEVLGLDETGKKVTYLLRGVLARGSITGYFAQLYVGPSDAPVHKKGGHVRCGTYSFRVFKNRQGQTGSTYVVYVLSDKVVNRAHTNAKAMHSKAPLPSPQIVNSATRDFATSSDSDVETSPSSGNQMIAKGIRKRKRA